ncbi:MAG: CaiB/BaiF CoA-transferase family protein [Woeseiaceae bacterium]|nr:CaiB/BaiF CoA-transferase family protein [Woeseiaceae bacterium]
MGPLAGVRVLEVAAIGASPMTGMILADMGADVIRVERASQDTPMTRSDPSYRGKRSIALDLKSPQGVDAFLRLAETADVVTEGFRPGVVERLGIGPEECRARNPALVYGRMTGWGQDGPLAQAAGHDINYISLTGVLHAIGTAGEPPVPPLNLVGDMGGGGMLLALGILAALYESRASGQGQVVDAAMTDGSALMMWMFHGFSAMGLHNVDRRGANILDGGAHFYGCYETADGKYVSIGSIEPQFYAQLIELAELNPDKFARQLDQQRWPELRVALAEVFRQKTRDEWCELLEGTDVCFAPVLSLQEAPEHPHNAARETYVDVDGLLQPAPAPRFDRTPSEIRHGNRPLGSDTEDVLVEAGFDETEIESLRKSGCLT